jgi:hypothetical protein
MSNPDAANCYIRSSFSRVGMEMRHARSPCGVQYSTAQMFAVLAVFL